MAGLTGSARLPAPDQIRAALRTSSGERLHWRSPSDRNGGEDEPEEPADPPEDDGGEQCSTAGCNGIIDPWTCECYSDFMPPWKDERVTPGAFSFGI